MQVVSVNPRHPVDDIDDPEAYGAKPEAGEKSFLQRNSKALKSILLLGVVGAVGVVGYVLGESQTTETQAEAASPTTDSDGTVERTPLERAKETLFSGYNDPSNEALTGELTTAMLDPLLDQWIESGSLNDQFLTDDVMGSFKVYRDSHYEDVNAIRALSSTERNLKGRELIGDYDEPLVDEAWELIEDADYSGGVVFGDDKVTALVKGSKCWVLAEESNSDTDWNANFQLGQSDIQSIGEPQVQSSACGCSVQGSGNWCAEYNVCAQKVVVGRGYKGFVDSYNAMNTDIWNMMQTTCGSRDIVLAGYSRGGALLNVLAYGLYTEGLVPTSKLTLVTFGSPRALVDRDSDAVHAKFTQWRMVYKGDIAPSVPYGWMGFKHYGTMRCYECNYSEGRDRPNWSWSTGDHTSYCLYFGDASCPN